MLTREPGIAVSRCRSGACPFASRASTRSPDGTSTPAALTVPWKTVLRNESARGRNAERVSGSAGSLSMWSTALRGTGKVRPPSAPGRSSRSRTDTGPWCAPSARTLAKAGGNATPSPGLTSVQRDARSTWKQTDNGSSIACPCSSVRRRMGSAARTAGVRHRARRQTRRDRRYRTMEILRPRTGERPRAALGLLFAILLHPVVDRRDRAQIVVDGSEVGVGHTGVREPGHRGVVAALGHRAELADELLSRPGTQPGRVRRQVGGSHGAPGSLEHVTA